MRRVLMTVGLLIALPPALAGGCPTFGIGSPTPQCEDGLDNDGDGLSDWMDPGCWKDPNAAGPFSYDPCKTNEAAATSRCQNGIDDDGDSLIDYPADPGCSDPQDHDESPFVYDQQVGEQRTAIVLVHEAGQDTLGVTAEDIRHQVLDLSNPHSFGRYVLEASYGRTWLTGESVGWFEVESASSQQQAITAADPQIDFSRIDRLIKVSARTLGGTVDCYGGGGGLEPITYQTDEGPREIVWVNASFSTDCLDGTPPDFSRKPQLTGTGSYNLLAHEFGHSLKLAHARKWDCPGAPYLLDESQCSVLGTDPTDQVGTGDGHYGAVSKERTKWFGANQVIVPQTSGEFTLWPMARSAKPVVLKVPRVECPLPGSPGDACGGDGRGWYYIEFRRPIGQDVALQFGIFDREGAEVRIDGFRRREWPQDADSLLLDMQQGDSEFTLDVGQSFTDPHRGTQISTTFADANELKVQVTFGIGGYCGDTLLNGDEECDDGNTDDTDGCLGNCDLARCGDGVIQAGVEECDDGNTDPGDGCSAACQVESGSPGGGCRPQCPVEEN